MQSITPITERLLDENQNLVLTLPVTDSQEFDLVFFRTLQTDSFYIDYDDEMPEISPDSNNGGFEALREDSLGGTGDSIFEIDDAPFTLHHFSVGVDQDDIRIYNSYSGVPQHGHETGIQVNVGDEKGYEHSQFTTTDAGIPSTRLEQIKFEGPTIGYGFHNDQNDAVKPRVTVMGKSYEVIPITSEEFQNKVISGQIPANFVTVGGLQNISPSLPEEWPANRRQENDALRRIGEGELLSAMTGDKNGR